MLIKKLLKKQILSIESSQFFTSVFWNTSGNIIYRGGVIVGNLFVARQLGEIGFGLVTLLISIVTAVVVFIDMGISSATAKFTAQYSSKDKNDLSYFLICLSISVFLISLIITISFALLFDSSLLMLEKNEKSFILICFLPLLISLISVLSALLVGREKFRNLAITNIFFGIFIPASFVIMSKLYGFEGYIYGYFVSSLLFVMCLTLMCKYEFIDFKFMWNKFKIKKIAKQYINFCIPLFILGFLGPPVYLYCNTLLVSQVNGLVELAILGVALQVQSIIVFLPGSLALVMIPKVSREEAQTKNLIYKKEIRYTVTFAVIPALVILLFSKQILELYGIENTGSEFVLQIIAIAGILIAVQTVVGGILTGSGHLKIQLFTNFFGAILLLISANILVVHAAEGIALARTISASFIVSILLIYLFYFKTRLRR